MPVHDWARVEDGIYHDFHVAWLPELRKVLNGGLLPEGYYALAEQHAGFAIADILTLHRDSPDGAPVFRSSVPAGGTAVAASPPRVRLKQTVQPNLLARRRSMAIRHVTGHRLIALIEILSPANKDRPRHVEQFAEKVLSALEAGVHVLVVDLFAPGPSDPQGIHGAILDQLDLPDKPYHVPTNEPLTLASYAAGPQIEMHVEHSSVGAAIPEMPLFLHHDWYINVPLEATYNAAYAGVPAYWREVLEGKAANGA